MTFDFVWGPDTPEDCEAAARGWREFAAEKRAYAQHEETMGLDASPSKLLASHADSAAANLDRRAEAARDRIARAEMGIAQS